MSKRPDPIPSFIDIARSRKRRHPAASDNWPQDLKDELDKAILALVRGDVSGSAFGASVMRRIFGEMMVARGMEAPSTAQFDRYWHERKAVLSGQHD